MGSPLPGYALSFDQESPAILFGADPAWIASLMSSGATKEIIERYGPADQFVLGDEGIGFGGVLRSCEFKPAYYAQEYAWLRAELPVLYHENSREYCFMCKDGGKEERVNCRHCRGTGHSFDVIHEAGFDFGKTFSALSQVLDRVGGGASLCSFPDPEKPAERRLLPLHFVFGQNFEGFEHGLRMWLSAESYLVISILRKAHDQGVHLPPVEEAIKVALNHIQNGTGGWTRPQAFMEPGWFLFGTEDDGGLIQSSRFQASIDPVEFYSHNIDFSGIAFAIIAGIASLYNYLWMIGPGIIQLDGFRRELEKIFA